jgi:aminoglycoside phosphotransferase (APT) family kinase protein
MHADQVDTDPGLVRRLLAGQFPRWADLPVVPVRSWGTDHDIYRLGDDLAVRLPKIGWAQGQAVLEATWLPVLAPHLPLAVPVPVALGEPAEGYPFAWSVQEWLPGDSAGDARPQDPDRAADDLAAFVRALQDVDAADGPRKPRDARGGSLEAVDEPVRRAVAALGRRVDAGPVLRAWEESLSASGAGPGEEAWIHADLLPGNLLVRDGRLSAVLDFGGLGVGDPACDLMPAWNLLDAARARRYRDALGAGDDAWLRGRGWALAQALVALPYYWDTNPGITRQALVAVARSIEA